MGPRQHEERRGKGGAREVGEAPSRHVGGLRLRAALGIWLGLGALLFPLIVRVDLRAASYSPSEFPPKTVYFASFEASDGRFFGNYGFKYAPIGHLDEQGFRLLALSSVVLRERDAFSGGRTNRLNDGRLLLGYEWQGNGRAITAAIGPSLAINSVNTGNIAFETHRLGAAFLVDLWQTWPDKGVAGSPKTVFGSDPDSARLGPREFHSHFTQATFLADLAASNVYFRLRHGFGVEPVPFFFGPEASISFGNRIRTSGIIVQDRYLNLRFGLHVSEIVIGKLHLGASAGLERREGGILGIYGQVATYIRY